MDLGRGIAPVRPAKEAGEKEDGRGSFGARFKMKEKKKRLEKFLQRLTSPTSTQLRRSVFFFGLVFLALGTVQTFPYGSVIFFVAFASTRRPSNRDTRRERSTKKCDGRENK